MTLPGPGGYEITWAPGAVRLPLEPAPSGHLILPTDAYDKIAATPTSANMELSFAVGHTTGSSSSGLVRPDPSISTDDDDKEKTGSVAPTLSLSP